MQIRARGESPIELHLLFVPECELIGAPRQKRGAPGAAVSEEENWAARKTDGPMVSQYLSGQPDGTVRWARSPEILSPNSSLA